MPCFDDAGHKLCQRSRTKARECAHKRVHTSRQWPGRLLAAVLLLQTHYCREVETHRRCSIGILKLESLGLEQCDAGRRAYSQEGTERMREGTKFRPHALNESHANGQYSAPYWLEKHIRASEFFEEDLDKAVAVYVDDYCYTVAWIAKEQSEEEYKDGFDPESQLLKGYSRLLQHPRYVGNNGSALVIFSAAPAWSIGRHHKVYCEDYWRSMHIVVERSQRLTCIDYARRDYLVVPYYSPIQVKGLHGHPPPVRTTFGFFLGACEKAGLSYGKRMRAWFVTEAQKIKASDMVVGCSSQRRITYPQVLMEMRRAVFCFLLPGDTPSSRRLTDIMLSGCIPVFLGPPWHAMPFAGMLHYAHFALFFRLDAFLLNSSMGFGEDLHIHEHLSTRESATDVFQPEWWTSWDADATGAVRHAASVEDVIVQLRLLPAHDVLSLQRTGLLVRSAFQYNHGSSKEFLAGQQLAGDLIVQAICKRAQRERVVYRARGD